MFGEDKNGGKDWYEKVRGEQGTSLGDLHKWPLIVKSNLLFNAQKIQKNHIFQISVDILSNTNFFQAFTASANVPAIYLQQFWETMSYNEKTGVYSCQVDEQWFDLSADLLRKALAITPINPAHPFELPPSGDTKGQFYPCQPVLTGKTSAVTKTPNTQFCKCVGIVTQTNVDHAEMIRVEFTQGIQTFSQHTKQAQSQSEEPNKKVPPILIPYGLFSKVINYYFGKYNTSIDVLIRLVHHTGDEL
ncbi:hypothetical protein Tco_0368450 [Tanacetum coccineum]